VYIRLIIQKKVEGCRVIIGWEGRAWSSFRI